MTRLLALRTSSVLAVTMVTVPSTAKSQSAPPCYAIPRSLTAASWRSSVQPPRTQPTSGLKLVREIQLPGPPSRFDYQSFDPNTGRLYINHMNAGRTVVFDANVDRVVAAIQNLSRATGVLAVPSHHQVYVSAAGSHEVAIIDDHTLKVSARVGGIEFPDGIAYAPDADKVFVSDEAGGADVVIDPNTRVRRSAIRLGGEAGNTHYDSVSHCILVAVQTRNQLVAIDPVSEKIVQRYDLDGAEQPHGFALDEDGRLAFVSCEGNARLLVIDLRDMTVTQQLRIADDPDVLAWDAVLRRLYVGAESGVLSTFWLDGAKLQPLGDVRAPHAHTVSVDPRTHRVYLPLENVNGHPLLRIFEPGQ
jgi:DNA-binding beta-propeller fold protein YncE